MGGECSSIWLQRFPAGNPHSFPVGLFETASAPSAFCPQTNRLLVLGGQASGRLMEAQPAVFWGPWSGETLRIQKRTCNELFSSRHHQQDFVEAGGTRSQKEPRLLETPCPLPFLFRFRSANSVSSGKRPLTACADAVVGLETAMRGSSWIARTCGRERFWFGIPFGDPAKV